MGCGSIDGPVAGNLQAFEKSDWRPAFQRMVADWWAYADQDQNRGVTPAEALRGGMKADRFQRYDLDGDGSLSHLELDATYAEFVGLIDFSSRQTFKLDRNGDGGITADELPLAKFQVRPAAWCPEPRPDIQELAWKAADTDGDAKLSAVEMPGFLVYFLERSYMLRIVTPLL